MPNLETQPNSLFQETVIRSVGDKTIFFKPVNNEILPSLNPTSHNTPAIKNTSGNTNKINVFCSFFSSFSCILLVKIKCPPLFQFKE